MDHNDAVDYDCFILDDILKEERKNENGHERIWRGKHSEL